MTKRRDADISGKIAGRRVDKATASETPAVLIHASAVRFLEKGILLLGPSGSGKSDLALRMIDAGAVLIADDQVSLRRVGVRLLAEAPARLAGLIELRGQGIMRLAHHPAHLDLAVQLQPFGQESDRLPGTETASWLGVALPKITLDARTPSAVARLKTCLEAERVF